MAEKIDKFTIKVKKAGKEYVQDSGRDQIFLLVDILNGKKAVVETRRIGFPLDASQEEIEIELEKLVTNYNNEYKFSLKQKVEDEAHAQADETIRNLEGLELS